MKTLQNNFTTPEQSKRLLELGLPADSADCYISYNVDEEDNPLDYRIGIRQNEVEISLHFFTHELPCWSVGRLIEIWSICNIHKSKVDFVPVLPFNMVENLIQRFENNTDVLDFLKLED